MNRFLLIRFLAALVCFAVTASGRAEAARLDFLEINGRLHVDLLAWGQKQGFRSRWNPRTGELLLTNRWARLEFKADTARMELDGVVVWLEWPVLKDRDRPCLSARDLESVVYPLLKPSKLPPNRRIRRIALSAGHGGKDPGNMEGARQEKVFTLKLAQEVERRLRAAGFEVVQVRERDEFVPLEERPSRANRRKADLYLALHFNGAPSGSGSAQGAETYALTLNNGHSTNGGRSSGPQRGNRQDRENLLLAYHIHRMILNSVGLADRGVKHANFVELRDTEMPAALIEGGFMDNREDALKIFSDQERGQLAEAIVDGIQAYRRLVERGAGE
ncbi:MAG: N-acetylmuramoyl-L-alanine amidase [Verrucomicrobiales bacterium]|nr:N-acetylmuramoyl-L-alanine amidase [Verrucomicrobiales bacterium]